MSFDESHEAVSCCCSMLMGVSSYTKANVLTCRCEKGFSVAVVKNIPFSLSSFRLFQQCFIKLRREITWFISNIMYLRPRYISSLISRESLSEADRLSPCLCLSLLLSSHPLTHILVNGSAVPRRNSIAPPPHSSPDIKPSPCP